MGAEAESLLRGHQQPRRDCNCRSEEEWSFHHPRPLPPEDKDKASNQSRREDHVRQGDQGEGKASEDHCEGLPSVCTEEADLDCCTAALIGLHQDYATRGNPTGHAWQSQCWPLACGNKCT